MMGTYQFEDKKDFIMFFKTFIITLFFFMLVGAFSRGLVSGSQDCFVTAAIVAAAAAAPAHGTETA
jgi:hypothetical protein